MEPAQNYLHTIYESTIEGAKHGTKKSILFIKYGVSPYIIFKVSGEILNRNFGPESEWPFFSRDCDLDRFKDISSCRWITFSTIASLSIPAIIVTGTLIGGFRGCIRGIWVLFQMEYI